MRAPLVLSPNPRPSESPPPIARTFLRAPAISTPMMSSEAYTR